MKDTFKAMALAETSLRKCEATLDRAEDRCAANPTSANALLVFYARDDVAIHTVALEAAQDAHRDALAEAGAVDAELAAEYISFGPVCNEDGTPTEFTKLFFGIK